MIYNILMCLMFMVMGWNLHRIYLRVIDQLNEWNKAIDKRIEIEEINNETDFK